MLQGNKMDEQRSRCCRMNIGRLRGMFNARHSYTPLVLTERGGNPYQVGHIILQSPVQATLANDTCSANISHCCLSIHVESVREGFCHTKTIL